MGFKNFADEIANKVDNPHQSIKGDEMSDVNIGSGTVVMKPSKVEKKSILIRQYHFDKNEVEGLTALGKKIGLEFEDTIKAIQKFPKAKITEMYLGTTLSMEIRDLEGKKGKENLLKEKIKEYEIGTFCFFNTVIVMKIKGEWKEEKKK